MINRAIFDSQRSNDSAILLCINNRFLSASLSLGYVPEQFLGEEAITWIASIARCPTSPDRQFGRMIASCLNSLSWQLRQPTEQASSNDHIAIPLSTPDAET